MCPLPGSKTITTLWREDASGKSLIETFPGLPFGTVETNVIPGHGSAIRSGLQTAGTAPNDTIVEVQYTLKERT
jgi:hypothetical protein